MTSEGNTTFRTIHDMNRLTDLGVMCGFKQVGNGIINRSTSKILISLAGIGGDNRGAHKFTGTSKTASRGADGQIESIKAFMQIVGKLVKIIKTPAFVKMLRQENISTGKRLPTTFTGKPRE